MSEQITVTPTRPYLARAIYEWICDNQLTPYLLVDATQPHTDVPLQFVKDGQIVVGNTMKLSLACDHRVVDGATGAQFLQTLRTYLEQPLSLLL